MSDTNRISAELTPAARQAIGDALGVIRPQLPFRIGLTPEERSTLPKMGDKTRAFDQKASGYMESNPEFLPGFISMEELRKDRDLRDAVEEVLRPLVELCQAVDDTALQLNSEIWLAELAYYHNVREAARRGVAGAQSIYDDLAQRFPRGRRAEPTPPPAA
jgi:hypothetical protein